MRVTDQYHLCLVPAMMQESEQAASLASEMSERCGVAVAPASAPAGGGHGQTEPATPRKHHCACSDENLRCLLAWTMISPERDRHPTIRVRIRATGPSWQDGMASIQAFPFIFFCRVVHELLESLATLECSAHG
jgi:hypothetical protein